MPGIVAVIHAFGRDLKWNPHVHVMMSLGAMGKSGKWRNIDYMPYKMLRQRWETVLLKNLEEKIGKKKIKACVIEYLLSEEMCHRLNAVLGKASKKGH